MNRFRKFGSIEQLHSVIRYAMKYSSTQDVEYTAKIKLHGTNACIQFNPNGDIVAQKRTQNIKPQNDNFGFAQWVEDNTSTLKDLSKCLDFEGMIYVYGEWAGKGIQKKDAVSQIDKSFYAFCIVVINEEGEETLIYNIDATLAPFVQAIDNFYSIPTFKKYTVNLFNEESLKAFQSEITADILAIGEEDPYIKNMFDVSGAGEGLVLYNDLGDSALMFKIKTEEHSVNKAKAIVHISPEVLESIKEFTDKYATDNRFEQGAQEIGELDVKKTGVFIGWVCKDICKEAAVEIEENDIDWKMASKTIASLARAWYFKKLFG